MHVTVPKSLYNEVAKQITSVVGVESSKSNDKESRWELMTYTINDGLPTPRLILSYLERAEEMEQRGDTMHGIKEIAFWVEKSDQERDETPYGSIVWKCL